MTDQKLSELIKLTDLKNLKHLVFFRNDMSGIIVVDNDKISIQEIQEKGVVISLPQNTCAIKHGVTLCFVCLPFDKKLTDFPKASQIKNSFEVIGKIKDLINSNKKNDHTCTVQIDFTQYDIKKWNDFVLSYIEQQNMINLLNKKI